MALVRHAAGKGKAMSIEVSRAVWARSKAHGAPLLLLLALADFANDDEECWPSVKTLATRCRTHPRNIQKNLAKLRALGELTAGDQDGPKGANRFRITVPDGVAITPPPAKTPAPAISSQRGGDNAVGGVAITPPEPSRNYQEPSKGSARKRPASPRFTPPTPDEARAFAAEIGLSQEQADIFTDHFEANGWKIGGKTPMRCWRAAMRNWQRRSREYAGRNGTAPRPEPRRREF